MPSGGLTRRARDERGNISAKVQVLEELKEELGLPDSLVSSARPFILVEDTTATVKLVSSFMDMNVGDRVQVR